MKYADYVVEGTPEACLAKVEGYLRSEWPYPGSFSRPLTGSMIQFFKPRRTLIDSPLGWLVLIGLSVVTAGGFAVAYAFYWLVFRSGHGADMQIIAALEGVGKTLLTVKTDDARYANEVGAWIQSELIENRAAAWSAERPTEPQAHGAMDATAQIRELAKLRDEGSITNQEFEAKKADLLNRM